MFVECSTQYTSFSSRKRPANAGTERKQFTEDASVALQQPMLTHAHTKCPPVRCAYLHTCSLSLIYDDFKTKPIGPGFFLLHINVSVKSKLQHAPPPPGIPRAFDTFAVPGRREFDYQSFPGGGKFDPHALGVGNLNCTLDFM